MFRSYSTGLLRSIALLCTVLPAGLALAAGQAPPEIAGCEAVAELQPICGLSRPEDIEMLDDGRWALLSQMGDLETGSPGSLAVLDLRTRQVFPLYPAQTASVRPAATLAGNGCSPPGAELSPHGIHLAPLADGRQRLLVVNHGGRESVEFFELHSQPGGDPPFRLSWTGCVLAPPDAYLNDVAATPEGGFVVSNMLKKRSMFAGLVKGLILGMDTGHVWEWSPREGFRIIPGSRGNFPNGVALSKDGRQLFLNLYGDGLLRKLDRRSGELLAEVAVSRPDNSSWTRDGRLLLVASHGGTRFNILNECGDADRQPCGGPFAIVAVDPITMQRKTLFAHQGAPMGTATIAVQAGEWLLMGSYVGDRVILAPLPELSVVNGDQ